MNTNGTSFFVPNGDVRETDYCARRWEPEGGGLGRLTAGMREESACNASRDVHYEHTSITRPAMPKYPLRAERERVAGFNCRLSSRGRTNLASRWTARGPRRSRCSLQARDRLVSARTDVIRRNRCTNTCKARKPPDFVITTLVGNKFAVG